MALKGWRGRSGLALVASALSLVLLGSCTSPKPLPACEGWCSKLCQALEDCAAAAPNCAEQCQSGMAESSCQGRPPDQLTCEEQKGVYACANYCATLCARAPSCGSFDSGLCADGCSSQQPPICNPASVDARSCDQLKPELRFYEDTGRAHRGGGDVVGFFSPGAFGLCETGEDCELPLGCTVATNTCGSCASDADCAHGFGSYLCTPKNGCTEVGCLSNDDCPGRLCDTKRHECGECLSSKDCDGIFPACDTATAACVACLSDADCTLDFQPLCDVDKKQCVGCLSDADCTDPTAPHCDKTFHDCFSE